MTRQTDIEEFNEAVSELVSMLKAAFKPVTDSVEQFLSSLVRFRRSPGNDFRDIWADWWDYEVDDDDIWPQEADDDG